MHLLNRIFISAFFILTIVACGFSESQFEIVERKKENEIQIITKAFDETHVLYTANYIPEYQDLYVKFENGSLLGYFPQKDKLLTITAWNDKKHIFELFFCNTQNGKVFILEKQIGWNFHIFSSDKKDTKWVAVVPQGKARLFLIDSKGNISQQVFFETEISPDIVRIEQRDNETILILESLDYYCEYNIDFKQKAATRIN